jgi:hypothetical protein
MSKEREVIRIYKVKPFASRPVGRPKNRWEDDVRKDLHSEDQQLEEECIG